MQNNIQKKRKEKEGDLRRQKHYRKSALNINLIEIRLSCRRYLKRGELRHQMIIYSRKHKMKTKSGKYYKTLCTKQNRNNVYERNRESRKV